MNVSLPGAAIIQFRSSAAVYKMLLFSAVFENCARFLQIKNFCKCCGNREIIHIMMSSTKYFHIFHFNVCVICCVFIN